MLDMFDSSLGELRVTKLAMHEAFFRGVEAANVAFSDLVSKSALALADAGAGRAPDAALDDELAALLVDREALVGACLGANEARVARVLKKEAELRAREEKRCAGAVAGERAAEYARNRGRVGEARAVAAACAARVAKALDGADGVVLAEGLRGSGK
jgi:hypothetical protein